MEIARIDASCPCIEISLDGMILAPSETVQAEVIVDLSKEPDFHGGLLLDAKGKARTGEVAFFIRVEVDVVADGGGRDKSISPKSEWVTNREPTEDPRDRDSQRSQ